MIGSADGSREVKPMCNGRTDGSTTVVGRSGDDEIYVTKGVAAVRFGAVKIGRDLEKSKEREIEEEGKRRRGKGFSEMEGKREEKMFLILELLTP